MGVKQELVANDKRSCAMSNQDNLDDIMPADEQYEILRAVIIDQHETVWPTFVDALTKMRELPEQFRHTHAVLLVEAIKLHFDWLRSNGIDAQFELTDTFGIEVLKIEDRQ
ncbi:hypothetical protein [Arthrobacter sp. KNU40]|uniref:hypothetical protein n=2 Tax=unclassified Arthrobacter TaxID=235627 RepID=UPI003F636428